MCEEHTPSGSRWHRALGPTSGHRTSGMLAQLSGSADGGRPATRSPGLDVVEQPDEPGPPQQAGEKLEAGIRLA